MMANKYVRSPVVTTLILLRRAPEGTSTDLYHLGFQLFSSCQPTETKCPTTTSWTPLQTSPLTPPLTPTLLPTVSETHSPNPMNRQFPLVARVDPQRIRTATMATVVVMPIKMPIRRQKNLEGERRSWIGERRNLLEDNRSLEHMPTTGPQVRDAWNHWLRRQVLTSVQSIPLFTTILVSSKTHPKGKPLHWLDTNGMRS